MIINTQLIENLGNKIDSSNNFERLKVLNVARQISKLSDPYFYVPAGYNNIDILKHPINSISNTAVNNFLSQMLTAFLPPNRLPFKLEPDVYSFLDWNISIKEEAEKQSQQIGFVYQPEVLADKALSELYQHYRRAEQYALKDLESRKARKSILESLKHCSFAGNAMMEYKKDKSTIRVYSLEHFAVERDFDGEVVEAVILDKYKVKRLDPAIKKSILKAKGKQFLDDKDEIVIYREISYLSSVDRYEEVYVLECETILKETVKRYKKSKLPYIFPCTNLVSGANYGMPIIHSILGHIKTGEKLRGAVNDTAYWNSMLFLALDPTSGINPKQIEKARNGQVLPLRADQLQMVNKNAHNELQSMSAELATINREIGVFFLSAMNAVRDGERITAEEIRMIRDEIHKSKGTTYNELENTLIHPMSLLTYEYLLEDKKIDKEVAKVDVKVITGVDAFTIEEDLMTFRMFIGDLANLGLIDKVNEDELIRKMSYLFNQETLNLIKTKQDLADEQMQEQNAMEQQQHDQLLQQLMQQGMGGSGGGM